MNVDVNTMKGSWHCAWVCFMGATIGTLVTLAAALQFGWGWWLAPIGALAFGGLGYLAYDWRGVRQALARAFKETAGWRQNPIWPKIIKLVNCVVFGPVLTLSVCFGVVFAVAGSPVVATLGIPLAVLALAWVMFFGAAYTDPPTLNETYRDSHKMFLHTNPVSATFWLIVGICHGLFWVAWGASWLTPRLPRAMAVAVVASWRFTVKFTVTFFRYLHSDARRICFTSTAMGVLAGFTFGYQHQVVLLGALLGGVVGATTSLIEYRLVAVHWLGLQPAHQRSVNHVSDLHA